MILENLKDRNIILASGSPRRKLLLSGLNIPFEVRLKNVEENYSDELKREAVPRFLSELKGNAFKEELTEKDILITSDTTVFLNGEILNKPKSEEDAKRMLNSLSGKTHVVITAVTIQDITKNITFHDETKVSFSDLSDAEIDFYIKEHKPFDKAGSYGAQEFMGYIAINKLEGSYFNVMGLPIHRVYEELKNW